MKPTLPTGFAFALAMLLPLNVDAQHDATAADALFRQGRQAMKRGDFATACPKFKESQRLDPAAGTVLNLAECEERLGMFASALQHYQEALDLLGVGDPRIRVAKAGLASAKKQAPKLTVSLPPDAPKGTTVLRDGVELREASMGTALPIDPGDHVLVAKSPGHEARTQTISIAPGESKEVTLSVVPEKAPLGDSSSSASGFDPTFAYAITGVGVVSLGVGAYFVAQAKSLNDEATSPEHFGSDPNVGDMNNGNRCDRICYTKTQDSRTASKFAYGFLSGGALLIAGGTAIFLWAPSPEVPSENQPGINVAFGTGSFRAEVGGTW